MTQTPPVPTLRELFVKHRNAADLTQEELAEMIGVSGGMIAHVEKGRRSLGRDATERAASAMKLTATERAELYVAREVASANLSERRPKGIDTALARGLAAIDAELDALGPGKDFFDDPAIDLVADRRLELYEQRDRMTRKIHDTESSLLSARLETVEAKAFEAEAEISRLDALVRSLSKQVRRFAGEMDADEELPDDAIPDDPEEGQSPQ